MSKVRFDEIGYWSEIKLDIIRDYAKEYSKVLANQESIRRHLYIDAFAGAGVHISKRDTRLRAWKSIERANVEPPFSEYHFIDLDGGKADHSAELTCDVPNVNVYNRDCNEVLLQEAFPSAGGLSRALCLLDPYKLNLNWEVVRTAGQMRVLRFS